MTKLFLTLQPSMKETCHPAAFGLPRINLTFNFSQHERPSPSSPLQLITLEPVLELILHQSCNSTARYLLGSLLVVPDTFFAPPQSRLAEV